MSYPYAVTWGRRGDRQPYCERFADKRSAERRYDELRRLHGARLLLATLTERSATGSTAVLRRLPLPASRRTRR